MWRNYGNVAYSNDKKRSLTDSFVAIAVAERPVLSQALWCLIAIVRDCDWHDHFSAGALAPS
jgi:hypothetical protein